MVDYLIKVEHLKKTFLSKEKKFELGEISFELFNTEITALVGLNGAGKTTLIKLILSLLKADSGHILFNRDLQGDGLKRIGYLPESFDGNKYELTVYSFLKFFCELNGISSKKINMEIDNTLSVVGLCDNKKQKVNKLSKGMKTRLGLAQALLGDPILMILDEPTDGLDPQGRKDIMELLALLKNKGKTILISSHILSEIENISDRILILDHGKMLLRGKLSELIVGNQNHLNELEDKKNGALEMTETHTFPKGMNSHNKYQSVEELFFNTIKKDV